MPSPLRLLPGTLAAIAGALVGAVVWAMVSSATGYQIGYLAVLVGFLAGVGMRLAGGGGATAAGIVAAVVGLAGCVVGNWLTVGIQAAKEFHRPLGDVLLGLAANPAFSVKLLQFGFTPMDLVFYAIAAYAGYRAAIRPQRVPSSVTAGP